MGDGSRHPLYHTLPNSTNPNLWTTPDFWLYNPVTNKLQLSNGYVYTFNHLVPNNGQLAVLTSLQMETETSHGPA